MLALYLYVLNHSPSLFNLPFLPRGCILLGYLLSVLLAPPLPSWVPSLFTFVQKGSVPAAVVQKWWQNYGRGRDISLRPCEPVSEAGLTPYKSTKGRLCSCTPIVMAREHLGHLLHSLGPRRPGILVWTDGTFPPTSLCISSPRVQVPPLGCCLSLGMLWNWS